MNRFGHTLSLFMSTLVLVLAGCSGARDSASTSTAQDEAPKAEARPFDPRATRTPKPSKSLSLAPDWQPPAPTRTAPAHVKARVEPPKRWGAPAKPVSANPTDAEIRALTRFPERLRPVPGVSSAEEAQAFAAALLERAQDQRGIEPIERFLEAYPRSRWAAALHLNLGQLSYEQGYFHDALTHWTAGWEVTREGEDAASRELANLALVEAAKMNARLGRVTEL